MIEVLIIICLALSLFLVVKNYPEARVAEDEEGVGTMSVWQKWFKSRDQVLEEIKEEVSKGGNEVLPPSEFSLAEKRFLESDPVIVKLLMDAEDALKRSDLRESEEYALEALKNDTRCAQAYAIIGKIAALRGSFDDAKEAYKTAVKCNFGLAEPYFGLGEICLREENFSEAIESLQKAVNLERNQAAWHAALGKAYMGVRQFAKAAKSFKRASSLDMDNKEYKDLSSEAEEKQRTHSQAFRLR